MYFENKEFMLFILFPNIITPLISSQSLSCIGRVFLWGLSFLIKLCKFIFYCLAQHTKKNLHWEANVPRLAKRIIFMLSSGFILLKLALLTKNNY